MASATERLRAQVVASANGAVVEQLPIVRAHDQARVVAMYAGASMSLWNSEMSARRVSGIGRQRTGAGGLWRSRRRTRERSTTLSALTS